MSVILNRRHVLKLGLGTAALRVVAACAPIAPPNAPARSTPSSVNGGASTTPNAPPTPAGQPKRGGTLRIGRSNEPSNLDPHLISPYGLHSTWMAVDRLTAYDDKLQPQPRLAESFELSSDSMQLKLNLRKGVTYHTGREFTS